MSAEEKIEAIYKGIEQIKIELGKAQVYREQQRKEIDILNKKVEEQTANQNKAWGIFAFAGLFATAFFTWVFKHI